MTEEERERLACEHLSDRSSYSLGTSLGVAAIGMLVTPFKSSTALFSEPGQDYTTVGPPRLGPHSKHIFGAKISILVLVLVLVFELPTSNKYQPNPDTISNSPRT